MRPYAGERTLSPMDRETHRRFLQYREAFPYWNAPSAKMLSREEFITLDAELVALEARGRDSWSGDDARRAGALKRRLLRD